MSRVSIDRADLVAALARWGIVPRKTFTVPFPTALGPTLLPAFVRGYFDGDGSVTHKAPRRGWVEASCKFTSGSRPMLEGLGAYLAGAGVATGPIEPGSGRALVLRVLTERSNLRAFAGLLYSGATVWLGRKRAIFDAIEVARCA